MNNFLSIFKRIFKIYFFVFILYSTIVFLFFRLSFFNIFTQVLFYKGLMILLISFLFIFIIFFFFSIKKKYHFELLFSALIFSFSLHLVFFVVFPVTFERSVTMYILNTLKNNQKNICGGLTKSQLEEKLINEYILKNDAVGKRINEQKIINFLNNDNKCLKITSKSENFLNFSEIIKKIYNINNN